MAQQRPLQYFNATAPLYGFTYKYENRYTPVSCPDSQKSLLAPCPKPNRKSAILTNQWRFGAFFAVFKCRTLTNSSQGVNRINFNFARHTQDTLPIKSYQNREFSYNGVPVVKRRTSLTQQEVPPLLIGPYLIVPFFGCYSSTVYRTELWLVSYDLTMSPSPYWFN